MIRIIAGVARGEGLPSAGRRAAERIGEELKLRGALSRGRTVEVPRVPLLNVHCWPLASRYGGVQYQLIERLREEQSMREPVLLYPGVLASGANAWEAMPFGPSGDVANDEFELALENALDRTGARAIVLEGTAGAPIGSVLGIARERDLALVVAIHDFSLFTTAPHQFNETTPWESSGRLELARLLLDRASMVVFPSTYLRRCHEQMLEVANVKSRVIAPGVPANVPDSQRHDRKRIAFVGSVRRHKGGHLIADAVAETPQAEWHVFGGGDEELLRSLRRIGRVKIHGYYRAGSLPSLLARHRIGLAVMPSIVPESFSLTLSECWLAGVPAVAFAHGAQGERIREEGGGWAAPVIGGARAIAKVVNRWLAGEITAEVPSSVPTPRDAAAAYVALYRELGIAG